MDDLDRESPRLSLSAPGKIFKIQKSEGTTPTERLLAELCERSFLKLWSYPNPYKDDGNELCDLLVVFENEVFIFFDREADLLETSAIDPQVLWDRWRRKAIDRQLITARGAERYLRSGRKIFLDARQQKPFPLNISTANLKVHKIVVAHGAKEACAAFSDANVYGSLAVTYSTDAGDSALPFMINLDKADPIHVLDSHNLPIILGELDTIFELSRYLDAKANAIARLDCLSYCGEEDLLAHYLLNFDKEKNQHYIGVRDETVNGVHIGEGEWKDFVEMAVYKNTKAENRISYLWDDLIQLTSKNALDGRLLGDSDVFRGRSAIIEMAKEPRFIRGVLARSMDQAIRNYPEKVGELSRNISFMPSIRRDKGYVFLQLRAPKQMREEPDYREKRREVLAVACAAAKNKFPHLMIIVGIGIDAPKFVEENSEDFILMNCADWPGERRRYYEEANKGWGFFQSPDLRMKVQTDTEFVQPSRRTSDQRS
jgi:hypothetical protein